MYSTSDALLYGLIVNRLSSALLHVAAVDACRSALEEIRNDLQERTQRWHKIEAICGFSVIANPGYDFLGQLLRAPMGSSVSSKSPTHHGLVSL